MPLVDYSSDTSGSDSGSDDTGIKPKRRKISSSSSTPPSHPRKAVGSGAELPPVVESNPHSEDNALPPLPSAFHDLYASTVRVSTSDNPALHQGRKRVNPHKVGSWPSHLYVEWQPSAQERTILKNLLKTLQASLKNTLTHTNTTITTSSLPSSQNKTEITSLLTSDLNTPQPLHISLSRPITLSTSQKDSFLSDLESRIKSSGIPAFELAPLGLEWHRTHESARSFLVLRVGTVGHGRVAVARKEGDIRDGGSARGSGSISEPARSERDQVKLDTKTNPTIITSPQQASNPQLASLLTRCNALVTNYGQPALYSALPSSIENAFHVSIAWSFAPPTSELTNTTQAVLEHPISPSPSPSSAITLISESPTSTLGTSETGSRCTSTLKTSLQAMRIQVDGIKAKIGNVVTHVPLSDARGSWKQKNSGRSLF
ncbi:hypothetical protein F5Y16DRAFT_359737 [Xylariaceae sp. FL0255]|nr:hypothetical protein F5Y16DRAFT_359737 [Xylariaceae sp. FL0255]